MSDAPFTIVTGPFSDSDSFRNSCDFTDLLLPLTAS
jgi:hypothetical protein